MAELRFDGRVAIVTGGGRGVGRAHALLLASRGAKVVVADYGGSLQGSGSSHGPADEVVSEIKAAGGQAVASYGSVADEKDAAAIVKAAIDSFGKVDILVNNAGISDPDLFEDLTPEKFRRMIDVHYLGAVYVTKFAWDEMRKAGYGRIVNTCSEGMLGTFPMVTSYGAAKAGVYGFTRTLAAEGPAYGILVNGIAPRAQTRMGTDEETSKIFHRKVGNPPEIMSRMQPERVAPAMAYLAHESCRLNGELIAAGAGEVQRVFVKTTKGVSSDNLTPEFIAENLDRILDETGAPTIPVIPDIRVNAVKGT